MTQWHGEGLGGYRQYLHSCRRRWSDHCVLHNDRVVLALVSTMTVKSGRIMFTFGLLCSFLGAPHLCLEQAGTHGLYPRRGCKLAAVGAPWGWCRLQAEKIQRCFELFGRELSECGLPDAEIFWMSHRSIRATFVHCQPW